MYMHKEVVAQYDACRGVCFVSDQFEKSKELSLEYFQIADEETLDTKNTKDKNKQFRAFIAVNAKEIRLIDNIRL